MRTYTVHEKPDAPADRLERAEALVFVQDGFSWAAAILTPFWMIANRLWAPLVAYLVGMALLQLLISVMGLPSGPTTWLWIGVHVIIGLEADAIRRSVLRRQGYAMIGSVSGRRVEDCERRFFEAWLAGQPFVAPTGTQPRGGDGRLGALAFEARKG